MKDYSNSKIREIVVDNFAGGGGASSGISKALGRSVDIAINHDPDAILMHKTNHPDSEHYCENVWDVDPRKAVRGRPIGLAWFSPDCKHHSKAKGGKPVEKSIRGLAWVATKWAGQAFPRVLMLENVEEFKDWGPLIAKRDKETGRVMKKDGYIGPDNKFVHYVASPGERVPIQEQLLVPDPKRKGKNFNKFINALRKLGYEVEWKELRACDYGAPTIRKRLFIIARRDGRPIVWPKPTHGDPDSLEVRCGLLQPWKTAADIIDWSRPCPSIFNRKKKLADNTLKRIVKGIQKFVIDNPNPFIVQVNYSGNKHHYCRTIDEPLATVTSKHGFGLITPVISQLGQIGGGDRLHHIEEPLSTIVTKQEHLLVTPTLVQLNQGEAEVQEHGEVDPELAAALISRQFGQSIGHSLQEPLGTITAGGGGKSQLVTAFISKYYGGNYEGAGADVNTPTPTITTKDHNAVITSHMIKLRGKNIGSKVTEPVHTITSGGLHIGEVRSLLKKYFGNDKSSNIDNYGIVSINGELYQIVDIGMRMLEPHELFAAQGFSKDYIIDRDYKGRRYTKEKQVARCGNAVPPPFAEALTRANLPELCIGGAAA